MLVISACITGWWCVDYLYCTSRAILYYDSEGIRKGQQNLCCNHSWSIVHCGHVHSLHFQHLHFRQVQFLSSSLCVNCMEEWQIDDVGVVHIHCSPDSISLLLDDCSLQQRTSHAVFLAVYSPRRMCCFLCCSHYFYSSVDSSGYFYCQDTRYAQTHSYWL